LTRPAALALHLILQQRYRRYAVAGAGVADGMSMVDNHVVAVDTVVSQPV